MAVRLSSSVCRGCRSQQRSLIFQLRSFSATTRRSLDVGTDPSGSPPSTGIARLQSRRLINVSGPDAAKHLHGLMTRNVQDGMAPDAGFFGAFLSAKGRVLHDVFVYPHNTIGAEKGDAAPQESFLIDVDASQVKVLWTHLKRYKLRQKVHIRILEEDEAAVWQAWADPSISAISEREGAAGALVRKLQESAEQARQAGVHILHDGRAPNMGYRLVTPGAQTSPPPVFELPSADQSAYRLRRYLRGVPEGQREILRDQALPFESNLDIMGGVDFRKGCYIGQELTIRTKHRGVVRKRTLPCVVYDPATAPPPALHYLPGVPLAVPGPGEIRDYDVGNIPPDTSIARVNKTGRAAGKWLQGVGNIGLGLCRLEVMTDVGIPGMPDVATNNADEGFVIQPAQGKAEAVTEDQQSEAHQGAEAASYEGPQLMVKAFVPDWLRDGLLSDGKH